jgi:hypothetical protein
MTETTSPFANLYLKIVSRLEAEVPELKFIDQDLGQLENYEIRPAVEFPCALIDVDDFDFTDAGNFTTQIGNGLLVIRLGVGAWSPSNNLAPNDVRLKALNYYEIEQKIHVALHGWSNDGFAKLRRKKAKKEERNDNIRVRVISYAVTIQDETTKPTRTSLPRPGATVGTTN